MRVEYHRLLLKKFAKLSPKITEAFYQRLTIFLTDKFSPILNNHSLTGKYAGFRSINVTGDHRAIFIESEGSVKFFDIDTHNNLYGK